MATLKGFRARKKSVQATRKITAAMKMVAAAKLHKAQRCAEEARPYARLMTEIMRDLLEARTHQTEGPPLLWGTGKNERHLMILVTSNRGLCGSFNSQVVRAARQRIDHEINEGRHVQIMCVGYKGREQLKRDFEGQILETLPSFMTPAFSDAAAIAQKVMTLFEAKAFDVCTLFYNKFVSALVHQATAQQLIPFTPRAEDLEEGDTPMKGDPQAKAHQQGKALSSIYEYEPNKEAVLEELLSRNLGTQIYRALLENTASEHGARMTAMEEATRNAGEMIDKLNLIINRTRQAQITMELMEVISGAEAL